MTFPFDLPKGTTALYINIVSQAWFTRLFVPAQVCENTLGMNLAPALSRGPQSSLNNLKDLISPIHRSLWKMRKLITMI
jgi:hypothetical protein